MMREPIASAEYREVRAFRKVLFSSSLERGTRLIEGLLCRICLRFALLGGFPQLRRLVASAEYLPLERAGAD